MGARHIATSLDYLQCSPLTWCIDVSMYCMTHHETEFIVTELATVPRMALQWRSVLQEAALELYTQFNCCVVFLGAELKEKYYKGQALFQRKNVPQIIMRKLVYRHPSVHLHAFVACPNQCLHGLFDVEIMFHCN